MRSYQIIFLCFICVFTSASFALEQYDILISMQSKNLYGIHGKSITIETIHCNEFANADRATIFIDGLDNTYLKFSNGNGCKVININNLAKESFVGK